MRPGKKTTEAWMVGVVTILSMIQEIFWPNSPFPKEQVMAVLAWVLARATEKGVVGETEKRAWQTTEFWMTAVAVIITYVANTFFGVPIAVVQALLGTIAGYMGIRIYNKILTGKRSERLKTPNTDGMKNLTIK